MKKICLLYVFALACLTVKAQNYIANLDDITISGEWNLASTEIPMDFIKSLNAYEYDIPLKIVLNDSGNSYIVLCLIYNYFANIYHHFVSSKPILLNIGIR